MARIFPSNVLDQVHCVLDAWIQIGHGVSFGDLNTSSLADALNEARGTAGQIINLENQLAKLRNQRDQQYTDLWQKLKRVRNGVKSVFGDDSDEYEQVGGTPVSERKSPRRSAPPAQ